MIAVDWGTSHLRAYRLDAGGGIVDQRRSANGATACRGRHAEVLRACIGDWDDADVVLCGMVGSRHGWVEVPYVDCPAGAAELAAAMQRFETAQLPDRRLWFVPGMADRRPAHAGDTMRGEETQVLALLDMLGRGRHVACLPGTHSKWVEAVDGRIVSVATAMTGELFDLLRRHGTLAELTVQADAFGLDGDAFDSGLHDSAGGGGLLHHLFGARARVLFGAFTPERLPAYLSGLLIGHEARALPPAVVRTGELPVHLIGSDTLLDAYAKGLAALGIQAHLHPERLAAAGMHLLARRHGLEQPAASRTA